MILYHCTNTRYLPVKLRRGGGLGIRQTPAQAELGVGGEPSAAASSASSRPVNGAFRF
jgi:hypothetical protein